MSKYKNVFHDLKQKIETGILQPNDELVSEKELMEQYGFSKDTIRKALSLLELEGYIQKMQGRNSIVLEHGRTKNNYLAEIRTSSELNRSAHHTIQTNVIDLTTIPANDSLMDIFKVDESVDFYHVIRQREIDGERLEYEESFFDRRLVPPLTKQIAEQSIYHYLEEAGLKITHSRREISFRFANEQEKKYMDLNDYDMVVVISSLTYLSSGQLFQYGTISYRPDKFTFITMAKR